MPALQITRHTLETEFECKQEGLARHVLFLWDVVADTITTTVVAFTGATMYFGDNLVEYWLYIVQGGMLAVVAQQAMEVFETGGKA